MSINYNNIVELIELLYDFVYNPKNDIYNNYMYKRLDPENIVLSQVLKTDTFAVDNEKILDKLGLSNIFNYYSSGLLTKKYNVKLLKRKWCYDLGKNGDILDLHEFSEFVLKYSDNIISRKCLVISKKINGHGGNQKTAIQLIELLDKYFIVEVFSNNINQKEYDFINDSLDSRIHNMKIIKKKRDEEIIDHINKNAYQFIINNKFNGYFKFCDKITNPNK